MFSFKAAIKQGDARLFKKFIPVRRTAPVGIGPRAVLGSQRVRLEPGAQVTLRTLCEPLLLRAEDGSRSGAIA